MDGFADRTALVTGAAGDFGSAFSQALAQAGATVLMADLPALADKLNAAADACRARAPEATVATVMFDVTDSAGVVGALGAAADVHGPVQLLVNNAGYQGRFESVLTYPIDDVRTVLDVNVVGAFTVLQVVANQMVVAGGGAIVNLASMAGASGAVNMPAYSASKSAIAGLTRAAAKDLAPYGIRVNAVSPGFIGPGVMWDRQVAEQARIPSAYFSDSIEEVEAEMIGSVPLRRYGSVDEVCATVMFLLSDGAGFINGVDIEISGGGR